jgi:hypothetical protein
MVAVVRFALSNDIVLSIDRKMLRLGEGSAAVERDWL